MTFDIKTALIVYGVFASVTTGIFWGAFLLGRLWARLGSVERQVETIDKRIDKAGERMSDLANEVQKLPDKFLSRRDALLWRGSRAEDPDAP